MQDGIATTNLAEAAANDARNLWRETAPGFAGGAGRLQGAERADVTIIGAGYTGCSAALHLAEAGASVRVLEARRVGHGAAGRNVGLVNAGLWLPPDEVETILGRHYGVLLNEVLGAAPALVFSLIDRHSIVCDDVRQGTLHCAHARRGERDLEQRLAQLRRRGVPAELLDRAEARRATGARGHGAALRDRRAGILQPMAYVQGLARAAAGVGAMIHEDSAVLGFERVGAKWRTRTEMGQVDSDHLLVAVHCYAVEPGAAWAPSFVPLDYFQVATAPVPPALRATILPGGEGAWDTAKVLTSFRLDRDGRFLLGAVGSLGYATAPLHLAWARRKLAALYPDLASLPFIHAWHGRIGMTSDHVPRIRRLGPGAYGVYGYNGRGIAPGTAFGRCFAELFRSGDEASLPLPIGDEPGGRVAHWRGRLLDAGAAAFHTISARLGA